MDLDQTQAAAFSSDATGNAKRWAFEFAAAKKGLEKWHETGEKIVRRYLLERDTNTSETQLGLFAANVQTLQATLYGNTPRVTVSRRFADASDDVARVAGEMLERLLNTDVERASDSYASALEHVLCDRLLPGLGVARVRYELEEEEVEGKEAILDDKGTELAPAVPATSQVSSEDVATDYVHWKDFLWSAGARTWGEVRWVAFRAKLSRDGLIERFGKEVGSAVPLNTKNGEGDEKAADPWGRADVWEVWERDTKRVCWVVEGYPQTLDEKDDPLGLEGFFPCPRPMAANLTTSKFLPRPDYALAQDLYEQVDALSGRIARLEESLRVVGIYDAGNDALKSMLTGGENRMIPVENWAALAEKGGLRGAVDWFPLEAVVNALASLRDVRTEKIDLLYQVTGMSDIMRGAAGAAGVTATEQSIKAKFGSVRIQRLQDEFARFASDLQRLKAEVVAKHFRPETIVARSNIERTPDAQFAQEAVALLKDELQRCYRVEVKSEAVSLTDFAALKQERVEMLEAVGSFLSVMQPIAQAMPAALPFMLEMLQASVAGLRGASAYESILDRAIEQAQKAAQQPQQGGPPPQQDPKVLAQQMKGQQAIQIEQTKLQADLVRTQAEVQADAQREENQAKWNSVEAARKQALVNAGRAMAPTPRPGGMP